MRRRLAAGAALLAACWPASPTSRPAAAPAAETPSVEARAWTLIDARTGEVLRSHAAAKHLPIASTTKLMTAYVAMQELPLDKIVRAPPYDAITASRCWNCGRGSGSACATSSTG